MFKSTNKEIDRQTGPVLHGIMFSCSGSIDDFVDLRVEIEQKESP